MVLTLAQLCSAVVVGLLWALVFAAGIGHHTKDIVLHDRLLTSKVRIPPRVGGEGGQED